MAKEKKHRAVGQEQKLDVEDVNRRLNMLDQRIDNIDSIVTAVAELIMNQPVGLSITCPRCGKRGALAS